MNVDTEDDNPLILFYDSDFPRHHHQVTCEENDKFSSYGVFDDIAFYRAMAEKSGDYVIELCCGSGRISVPLANDGKTVTGVDISKGLLRLFEQEKAQQSKDVQERLTIVHQNVAELDVQRGADLIIMPFNSFNCLVDMNAQLQALMRAHEHLKPGGYFIFDLANPFTHYIEGFPTPQMAFERTEIGTGKRYARFVGQTPMEIDQTQTIYGWYDRTEDDGTVKNFPYTQRWRLVFLNEVAMMLAMCGLNSIAVHGGFKGEPYTRDSTRIVLQAQKPS